VWILFYLGLVGLLMGLDLLLAGIPHWHLIIMSLALVASSGAVLFFVCRKRD
jgi:O-antigen/teichoic acid export membrane protein